MARKDPEGPISGTLLQLVQPVTEAMPEAVTGHGLVTEQTLELLRLIPSVKYKVPVLTKMTS